MLPYSKLVIEYANPQNLDDSVVLPFLLEDNSVVPKWICKVVQAKELYSIDDPERFYGFGSVEQQQKNAINKINNCVDVINSHRPIIQRKLTEIQDQDTLNYLHHVFEVYHGLLDQQTHEFYISSPPEVKTALANLNLFVHRCESVYRGAEPRHVVTWFGLPKTDVLSDADYDYFTDCYTFGTVYLNYVEIGKTLEDLAQDNDQYIADEAFRPFRHYSADFNVKYYNTSCDKISNNNQRISGYYQEHQEFFKKHGYDQTHPYLRPGSVPLAKLIDPAQFELIKSRQYVKSVAFE